LLLSGTFMDTPPKSVIILTGAVCVTMHPDKNDKSIVKGSSGAPNGTIGVAGGNSHAPSSTPATPLRPTSSPGSTWTLWLSDLFFKK
jgi:hypothetical protein